MKVCLDEKRMLRLRWSDIPAGERAAFRTHLQRCPQCSARWADLSAVWDALDGWSAEAADVDLTGRILAAAAGTPQSDPVTLRWRVPARAAASVLLALGLGVAAGQLIGPRGPSPQPPPIPTQEETKAALGLSMLGIESATGLPLGVDRADEDIEGGAS